MKSRILLSIVALAVLVSSLGFAPAPQADKDKDKDHAKDFTATIALQQDKVVNVPLGGNQWRTTEEVFSGKVTSSSWPAIADATVKMNGTTDYTLDPIMFDPITYLPIAFVIKGTTKQTMEIITKKGTLKMRGRGTIEGTIPFGADINMVWESSRGTGKMEDIDVEAKMKANFTWLSLPPSGIATMNGIYDKDD